MHVVFSRIKWQNVELNLVQKNFIGPEAKTHAEPSRQDAAAARVGAILSL